MIRTLFSLKIIHALEKLNTTSPRNTKKKKYLPLNPFPLKFSLICGICKISDFYQRFLSFLFRSIYIIASTDFPKQRSICFETFSPQFHFLLSPARDNRKVHRLSNSRGHGMRAKRLQRTTFYRLHSLIMRTRCLTRSKRSHVPVCSAPAPRLTRSNRNIPVRGRYGNSGSHFSILEGDSGSSTGERNNGGSRRELESRPNNFSTIVQTGLENK